MIMIIGGAYQGKLLYAVDYLTNYIEEKWMEGENVSLNQLSALQGVNHFHQFIWKEMELQREKNPDMSILDWEAWGEHLAELVINLNPKLIIVTDEIGYGIVPIDKKERDFREVTGRVCTKLATYSTEVHRVVCGIGKRIK